MFSVDNRSWSKDDDVDDGWRWITLLSQRKWKMPGFIGHLRPNNALNASSDLSRFSLDHLHLHLHLFHIATSSRPPRAVPRCLVTHAHDAPDIFSSAIRLASLLDSDSSFIEQPEAYLHQPFHLELEPRHTVWFAHYTQKDIGQDDSETCHGRLFRCRRDRQETRVCSFSCLLFRLIGLCSMHCW